MRNIEWIFFDMGGVLADESDFLKTRENYNWDVVRYFQPKTTKEEILAAWPQASSMFNSLDDNVIEVALKDKSKLPEALALLKERKAQSPKYYDLLKVRPEALKVIPQLAKKYKLGIMANQSYPARHKLEEAGLLKHFQNTDVSEDHNLRKPDPLFFKKILEITKADPIKSAMIDDNIERGLSPAKQLGMTTIWYQLYERNPIPSVIDYTISSLNDLLTL